MWLTDLRGDCLPLRINFVYNMFVCVCANSWDLPGCCSRQRALPRGGTAVTLLFPAVGAGRGYCRTGKGFHLIRGLIYARHKAWMTQRHTIHQNSLREHLLPPFNLAVRNKRTKTGKGAVIYHTTITARFKGMQKKQKWKKRMCRFNFSPICPITTMTAHLNQEQSQFASCTAGWCSRMDFPE